MQTLILMWPELMQWALIAGSAVGIVYGAAVLYARRASKKTPFPEI
ncbi:hypothetical protein [Thiomonas sp.]